MSFSIYHQLPTALLTFVAAICISANANPLFAQQLADGIPPLTKKKTEDDNKSKTIDATDKKETSKSDTSNKSGSRSKSSRSKSRPYSRNSDQVLAPFFSIVAEPAKSTVEISDGRKRIAMGTIVDSSGLILTKASELKGDLECKLLDGRKARATVFGVHADTDLALIKIELENLKPIQWSEIQSPISGSWLISPAAELRPMSVGVVSVEPRKIRHHPGYMGVRFVVTKQEPTILSVDRNTPAERAGIKVDDVIVKVNGDATKTRADLVQKVQAFRPGDSVTVTVLRKKKELDLTVTLGNSRVLNPNNNRSNMQNRMGSRNSRRNADFPLAFQHDSALTRDQIGGSILDLNGNVVGINIARQGRVSSLALPLSIVLPVLNELKTGKLAPAVVNKARVELIDKQLATIGKDLKLLPKKKERWEYDYDRLGAREEELQKIYDDIKKRLDSIKKDRGKAKEQLDDVKDRLRNGTKTKERLEAERKKLLFDGK